MLGLTATVAIDKASYAYDKLYSYNVPPTLCERIGVGMRVLVPFGKGNRRRIALVMSLRDTRDEDAKNKSVTDLVDAQAVIDQEGIELISFLKHHTFCRYFDAVNCLLPAGMALHTFSRYTACDKTADTTDLEDVYREVYAYIVSKRNGVLLHQLTKQFPEHHIGVILPVLETRGLIEKVEETKRKIGDETIVMVRLTEDFIQMPQSYKPTKKQNDVIAFLADVSSASLKEVTYYTGVTRNVTDNLVKAGVCEYFESEILRNPYENITKPSVSNAIQLTASQQEVYDGLFRLLDSPQADVALLHGVTGSGKTLIYLKLAQEVVRSGKSVVVMVPEIALTPQTVARFHAYFGKDVAVMHSGFTLGERLDEWKRIKNGQARVVVGTRSAVFAPLDNIGLIVIDEEQEHTYKSESSPRFSTHDVAKFRALHHQALVLLASATPSIESYYYAKTSRYHLFELQDRFADAELPEVLLVDMTCAEKGGNGQTFSQRLLDEIEATLNKKQQVILLLNRRGYNTSVTCAKCGETLLCPNCSIALTYHAANDLLMCHYCSYSQKLPHTCPSCENERLRYNGVGTQKIEEELQIAFPAARILRMDMDTTLKHMSHEQLLNRFAQREYDILIGTQMVSKGLDFENVTLAGVLNIDQSLYANDFRAFERTFSLITQVVGRSGRGQLNGQAVIQTYLPDSPVIRQAAKQDYKAFYEEEIANRRVMVFPPFCDLCCITFSGASEKEVIETSERFLNDMTALLRTSYNDLPLKIIGPVPCAVAKINNKFRYKIVLKCKNSKRFRCLITEMLTKTESNRTHQHVAITADINPFNSI